MDFTAVDVIDLRKKLDMTQDNFAKHIGVTRRTIISYEQGGLIPESRKFFFINFKNNYKSESSLNKDLFFNSRNFVEEDLFNQKTENFAVLKQSVLDSKYIKVLEDIIRLKDENSVLKMEMLEYKNKLKVENSLLNYKNVDSKVENIENKRDQLQNENSSLTNQNKELKEEVFILENKIDQLQNEMFKLKN